MTVTISNGVDASPSGSFSTSAVSQSAHRVKPGRYSSLHVGQNTVTSCRHEVDGIAHADRAGLERRRIDARVVPVEADDRLLRAAILFRGVGIEVDHHAAFIAHPNAHGRPRIAVTEQERSPDPFVLEERLGP